MRASSRYKDTGKGWEFNEAKEIRATEDDDDDEDF